MPAKSVTICAANVETIRELVAAHDKLAAQLNKLVMGQNYEQSDYQSLEIRMASLSYTLVGALKGSMGL